MLQSFVLRLVVGPLADGAVVGQVQDIASGRTSTFRNLDELLVALRAHVDLASTSSESI